MRVEAVQLAVDQHEGRLEPGQRRRVALGGGDDEAVDLPAGEVLLASEAYDGGALPPASAAWLRV